MKAVLERMNVHFIQICFDFEALIDQSQ